MISRCGIVVMYTIHMAVYCNLFIISILLRERNEEICIRR